MLGFETLLFVARIVEEFSVYARFLPLETLGEVVGGLEEKYHDMVLADRSFSIGPISAASQDRSKLHNVQQYICFWTIPAQHVAFRITI
jgi:hypothetical protein